MNKIYAHQKGLQFILIDDPIQTIDDINMVGLVDLLRDEFSDSQLFISTHEERFARYLTYKYWRRDKKIKMIDMKELALNQSLE